MFCLLFFSYHGQLLKPVLATLPNLYDTDDEESFEIKARHLVSLTILDSSFQAVQRKKNPRSIPGTQTF